MKKLIEKIRVYLVLKLLTKLEIQLISEVVYYRIKALEKTLVEQKWDSQDIYKKDLELYRELRKIFNK